MDKKEERDIRIEKVNKLREKGIIPYSYRAERSHTISTLLKNFDIIVDKKEQVTIAGRVMAKRMHGKTCFMDIHDENGKIQIYIRKDVVEQYSLIELLDIGDFLQVSGEVFKTKTEEPTIYVKDFKILSKSLRPLPEKWHGLKDTETRFRKRYLDFLVNKDAREKIKNRAIITQIIRDFFNRRGFIEIETPILQPIYGGAFAIPFKTYYNALERNFYLRIADELYLKRLLVGGFEKVYEIGKDFRNEGVDRLHNPEFTQIEAYQVYADYNDMMELVKSLFMEIGKLLYGSLEINFMGNKIDLNSWTKVDYVDSINEKCQCDVLNLDMKELKNLCKKYGISVTEKTTRNKIIDKLFSSLVQEHLIQPSFVVDHPIFISPLAKEHREKEGRVERFELIVGGLEIANSFSELNDPIEQRKRFLEQIKMKEEFTTMDEDFIEALEYGMPPAGGIGIGIDRLVMLFTNSTSIREIIAFPQLRK